MNSKTESQTNNLKISEDVIAKIVEIAVSNIDGISELTKSKIRFGHLFNSTVAPSSITVNSGGGSVGITVNVIVSNSCKVKQVAENIQNKVKDNIQNMTGIVVSKVNVIIGGIAFDSI